MKRMFSVAVIALAILGAAQSARADVFVFGAGLSGPAEDPPNNSPGTGSATVTYDSVTHMLRVQATFSGLTGNTTAAHIHTPTPLPFTGVAGVATTTPTFPNFPLGVTAGSYDRTFDLTQASSYNPAFITANGGSVGAAEAALIAGIMSGRAYFNIHTTTFGGGEIRGFLVAVPEPAALVLLGTGLAGVVGVARRRRRAKEE